MPLAPGVFLFEISVGGVHGHVFPARLRSGTTPEQKRFIEEGRNSHQVSPKTVDASIVPRCMAFYNCFPSRGLPMSVQVLWSATTLFGRSHCPHGSSILLISSLSYVARSMSNDRDCSAHGSFSWL